MHPTPAPRTAAPPTLSLRAHSGDALQIDVAGSWTLSAGGAALDEALGEVSRASAVTIRGAPDLSWDSVLVRAFLVLREAARSKGIPFHAEGIDPGVVRLADLAEAVPEKEDARRIDHEANFLSVIGLAAAEVTASLRSTNRFVGELTLAAGRRLSGKGFYRGKDFLLMLRRTGVEALGITALVAFLLGLILAFIGAIQLEKFGATIFVADLVGIGMVRDMGALMTGIVMAGRSGAAFAAEIGSMKSTNEIDALETNGISPMDFLVLPRVMAITLMMPLLTVFADVVGVFGGGVVAWTMLDISPRLFLQQAAGTVTLGHFFSGLVKGAAYGLLVGIAGCMRGLEAKESSLAVGAAATSAVVTAIVWIIAACGLFQFVSYVLGI